MFLFCWEETNNKVCEMVPWRKLKPNRAIEHNSGVLVAILNSLVMEGLAKVTFEQKLNFEL